MARVFLLEDHSWFRKALADLLGRQPDLEVIAQAGSKPSRATPATTTSSSDVSRRLR